MPPPITVNEYIDQFGATRFDTKRFACIPEVRTDNRSNAKDRAGAWTERWKHNPYRKAIPDHYVSDLQWYRCAGEEPFVHRLQKIWREATPREWQRDPYAVDLQFVARPKPYQEMYLLNRERWGADSARDARMRMHYRDGKLSEEQMFALWHNVEVHSIPFGERVRYHVSKPYWWADLEIRGLNVMSPVAFAYLGSRILNGDPKSGVIWISAVSEFVVSSFWTWVVTCQYGCEDFEHRVTDKGFDPFEEDNRPRGRMFYVRSTMLNLINHIGIAGLVEGSDVHPRVAADALAKMSSFRWDHRRDFRWVEYDWQANLFWGERLPRPVAYRSLDDPVEPSRKRQRQEGEVSGWAVEVAANRSVPGTPRARRLVPSVVDLTTPENTHRVPHPKEPVGEQGRGEPHRVVREDPYFDTPRGGPRVESGPHPTVQAGHHQRVEPARAGPRGSEPPALELSWPMRVRAAREAEGYVEGSTVTEDEFVEFQKECVRFSHKKPETLPEALRLCRDVIARAAMYGWLTRSVGQFQEALENQLGLLGVQSRLFLERHTAAAAATERPGAGRPDPVEAARLKETAEDPYGGSSKIRAWERLLDPGTTVEDLEKLTSELVRRWRSRLAPPIAYPTETPKTPTGATAEAGPSGEGAASSPARAEPEGAAPVVDESPVEPGTEGGDGRDTPAGSV